MKYRAIWLPAARRDRETVRKYLDQFSNTAYSRIFGKIKDNIDHVQDHPYMFEVYERHTEFRRMVVEDYLLFYVVNESKKQIEIHHVFHGAMDIKSQL